jgi:hypothetical protein
VAAKEFLNSLISPQNSRNFPAFTCFPCLICCKTGACRDVAVSFHIRLGYGTETRMQYVFEIGLRHTDLFNMCGRIPCFDLEHLAAKNHVKPIDVLCCKAIPKNKHAPTINFISNLLRLVDSRAMEGFPLPDWIGKIHGHLVWIQCSAGPYYCQPKTTHIL